MKLAIIYAMAFYVFYIFFLLILSFRGRVAGIKSQKLRFSYFKDYQPNVPVPELMRVRDRHFENQFQMPILFFISCLTYLSLNLITAASAYLVWAFIATRLIHSFIHLGSNNVQHRLYAYAPGLLLIMAIWIDIVVNASLAD